MIVQFKTLRKLKTLDLHGNKLTVLKRNQFKNLRDVEVLDISFNNITKLDSSHIADLTKLSWCNVSNNALAELTRYNCVLFNFINCLRINRAFVAEVHSREIQFCAS